jgi:hypothetical protein
MCNKGNEREPDYLQYHAAVKRDIDSRVVEWGSLTAVVSFGITHITYRREAKKSKFGDKLFLKIHVIDYYGPSLPRQILQMRHAM